MRVIEGAIGQKDLRKGIFMKRWITCWSFIFLFIYLLVVNARMVVFFLELKFVFKVIRFVICTSFIRLISGLCRSHFQI